MICEIHQFHLHFSHYILLRSLGVFSKMAYSVWEVFHVLFGRTFVFGLHTKKPKNLFFQNLVFFQPWHAHSAKMQSVAADAAWFVCLCVLLCTEMAESVK